MNSESMATFFGHFPSGTSFRSLDHYRQLVLAKRFQMYDFGTERNKIEYNGAHIPPKINLDEIKDFPLAIFCGKEDLVCTP